MLKLSLRSFLLLFVLCYSFITTAVLATEDVVVADGAITISRSDFEQLVSETPDIIRSAAARDVGDRFALINDFIAARKMIAEADLISPEDPGYAELQKQLNAVKQQFVFNRAKNAYVLPDLNPLAEERYLTQKDKYAKIPETRASSHILFYQAPGPDRTELRLKAQAVLEELRGGADFEAYVEKYSQDPGSRERKGSIDIWARYGDPSLSPPYTESLFEIGAIGEYSKVTDTQFGVHIIRLDGIRESDYKTYDEVKTAIISDLAQEHYGLATKAARIRYNLSEEAFIDGDAMEEIFAPYQPTE